MNHPAGGRLSHELFIDPGSGARASTGSSQAAAHQDPTGGLALLVHVLQRGKESWHIQIKSSAVAVQQGTSYKACIWALAEAPPIDQSGGSGSAVTTVRLDLIQTGSWKWIKGKQLRLSNRWSQHCLRLLESSDPGQPLFWAVQLGTAMAGTKFLIGAWTLEHEPIHMDRTYLESADRRIEEQRKGDLSVRLLDSSGMALAPQHVLSLSLTLVQHGFPFGTALMPEVLSGVNKEWYLETTRHMFNALVPESLFKWPEYEPTRGNFQDALKALEGPDYLGFAGANNFVLVRGHALEWLHDGYGFSGHWSRQDGCDAYRVYLQERITRDVGLFAGRFRTYDVWNEVLHERRYIDECGLWSDTLKDAFRWAAAADPTAQLCINDYGLISEDEDWEPLVELVGGWLAEGVPVHCIGVQAHIMPDIPTEHLKYRLDRLAALELPLYITEFDMLSGWRDGHPYWGGTEQQQADAYQRYVTLFFSHPGVKGIWWWGWWDRLHWIDQGGLFRMDRTPKQAALMLQQLMAVAWNTTLHEECPPLQPDGGFHWRGFFGTYQWQAHMVDGSSHEGRITFPFPQPHINDLHTRQSDEVRLPVSAAVLDQLPSPCEPSKRQAARSAAARPVPHMHPQVCPVTQPHARNSSVSDRPARSALGLPAPGGILSSCLGLLGGKGRS